MRIGIRTGTGLALGLWILAAALQGGEAGLWMEDFAQAKAEAQKQKKDLLLVFTGSDWSPPCQILKEEILDAQGFKEKAQKFFVLVEADFPQKKKQDAALKKKNETLKNNFRVQEFPTLVLVDVQDRVFGITSYRPGGVEAFLEHLGEFLMRKGQRDKGLEEAGKAQGIEKAKLLDQTLEPLRQDGLLIGYDEQIKAIIETDADNTAGLKEKYEGLRALDRIEKALDVVDPTPDAAALLNELDAFLKNVKNPNIRQRALLLRFHARHRQFQNEAIAILEEALKAAPTGDRANEIQSYLRSLNGP